MEKECLVLAATEHFEITGRGDCFFVELLPEQFVNIKDVVQILFQDKLGYYEIIGVESIRSTRTGAQGVIGLLVKPVVF